MEAKYGKSWNTYTYAERSDTRNFFYVEIQSFYRRQSRILQIFSERVLDATAKVCFVISGIIEQ